MSIDELGSSIASIANGISSTVREIAAVFEGEGGFILMLVLLLVVWYVLAG